jgi:hypothetical protein
LMTVTSSFSHREIFPLPSLVADPGISFDKLPATRAIPVLDCPN